MLGDVVLDGVRVPADHRIGQPGEGFRLTLATLATFRVSVAGAAEVILDSLARQLIKRYSGGSEP